ncbi:hypothetical protein ACIBCT_39490 [Streptosporangium sp. NPDC050855]|uniref:hypothetical protein n=1 Tax=Streptosporangium sp. NPDC050855 TaxID=3366194 RepID=UPI00378CDF8F
MDHGFGASGQHLVVTGQAAVEHQPAQDAFDDPAPGQGGESPGGGVAADDFDVDAQCGAAFDSWPTGAPTSPSSSTQPQTLAHALADSPVGQLAWDLQLFGDEVSDDYILTNATIY